MKKSAKFYFKPLCVMIMALLCANHMAFAQENITSKLIKPKLYENRKLPSENTADKKLGAVKKLKENIAVSYTHLTLPTKRIV